MKHISTRASSKSGECITLRISSKTKSRHAVKFHLLVKSRGRLLGDGPRFSRSARAVERALIRMWPEKKSQHAQLDPSVSWTEALPNAIQKLSPENDVQRSIKSQAVDLASDLAQMRWLLYEQAESSISMPMLIVVTSWLAIIFLSVGLFAPPNTTVIVALMLATLSVSGAIFLILELDMPFDGVIHISSAPMRNALEHLGQR